MEWSSVKQLLENYFLASSPSQVIYDVDYVILDTSY